MLDGGEGDDDIVDRLTGGGFDVRGFAAGAGSDDRLDLRAFGDDIDFAWVTANAREVNGDTVLDFGGQQITLLDVELASLHVDDFLI